MKQQLRFLLNFIFPLLVVWLESRLNIDRSWSLAAISIRIFPFLFVTLVELDRFRRFRSGTARTLAFVGACGFLAPLFIGPQEYFECLGLYSTLAALVLWSTKQNLEQTDFEKPLYRGLITICVILFFLSLSVYKGAWGGLYTDLDIARGAFLCLLVALPFVYFVEMILKMPSLQKQTAIFAVTVSLVSSLFFLSWRVVRFDSATAGLTLWVVVSVTVLHAIFCAALLNPLPQSWWDLKWVRWPSMVICLLAVMHFISLSIIAGNAELNTSAELRANGAFEKQARHIQDFPERKVASNDDEDEKADIAKLRILNINAWLVETWIPRFIISPSRDIEERARLLPAAVAKYNADIIVFQEIWKINRRVEIEHAMRKFGYNYAVRGSNTLLSRYLGIGNGLLIVSKFPLDRPEYTTFSSVTRLDSDTIFSRKGAIKTRVDVSSLVGDRKWIDLYASQLGESGDSLLHAAELAAFVKATHKSESLILAADLNASSTTPEYRKVASVGLDDPVVQLYPNDEAKLYTYDANTNEYAPPGAAGRNDFIFSSGDSLTPINSERVLTDMVLSDHFGVLTTFGVGPDNL